MTQPAHVVLFCRVCRMYGTPSPENKYLLCGNCGSCEVRVYREVTWGRIRWTYERWKARRWAKRMARLLVTV